MYCVCSQVKRWTIQVGRGPPPANTDYLQDYERIQRRQAKKKKKKVVVSSLTVMHASFNNRPSPNRTTICIHAVLLVRPTDNHSLSFTSLSPSPSPSLLCSRYSISIGDDRACMAFPWHFHGCHLCNQIQIRC